MLDFSGKANTSIHGLGEDDTARRAPAQGFLGFLMYNYDYFNLIICMLFFYLYYMFCNNHCIEYFLSRKKPLLYILFIHRYDSAVRVDDIKFASQDEMRSIPGPD